MKIHLRADSANVVHTRFTVFINEKNCGQLCMSPDDAASFHQIVSFGAAEGIDEFKSSGKWFIEEKQS